MLSYLSRSPLFRFMDNALVMTTWPMASVSCLPRAQDFDVTPLILCSSPAARLEGGRQPKEARQPLQEKPCFVE